MNLDGIKLEKVTSENRSKLENLMSLYLHDLSEFADDLKINNENGKFEYEGFGLYFKIEDLRPFFIIYQGETAGFVLLNGGKYVPQGIDYVVHELFILKGFRRKGIADAAIKNILDMYKGKYKIGQIAGNKAAVSFWTNFYKSHDIKYTEAKEKFKNLECITETFNI